MNKKTIKSIVAFVSFFAMTFGSTLLAISPSTPIIAIETLNGVPPPFDFSCPDNPLETREITLTGSGQGSAPPGLRSQYWVQIAWGDGNVTNGLGTFSPHTPDHGVFTFIYSATHTYAADGLYIIKARLYHSQPPGNDNQADAVATLNLCISVPYCGDGIINGDEECDDGNNIDGDGCSANCTIEIPGPQCTDNDQDGYSIEGGDCGPIDCDDENANINPGADEICCNQIDDDCDGLIDDLDPDCQECEPEATQPCDTGLLGICSMGTQTCTALGFWGECLQNEQPIDEICDNGLDDDCDGDTDCSDEACFQDPVCSQPQCTPEDTRPCETGQLGICSGGTQTCNTQGFWGECVQNKQPTDEICDNGLDDDCDGYIDSEDSDCEEECIPEGGSGAVVPGELSCCPGLVAIGCDTPDQEGNCSEECTGAFYCTYCGNGICGLGENKCNCPEDCGPKPECTDLDEDGYSIEGGDCGPIDCDDENANINPGADEICDNEVDDDCDGYIDGEDSDCQTPTPYCGDGSCNGSETCATCPQDCGSCSGGGGGGGGSLQLIIFNETLEAFSDISAIVSWQTNLLATSRVVYDTLPHPSGGTPPNYGYAYSTIELPMLTTLHLMAITGLTPNTIYYWRPISHGSGEVLGKESAFATVIVETPPGTPPETPTAPGVPTPPEIPSTPETPEVTPPPEIPEITVEEGQGMLSRLLAAAGNFFSNLCPLLLLLILILIALLVLSIFRSRKKEERVWVLSIIILILILIYRGMCYGKYWWVLIIVALIAAGIGYYFGEKKDRGRQNKIDFLK